MCSPSSRSRTDERSSVHRIAAFHVKRFEQRRQRDRLAQELIEAAIHGPHPKVQGVAARDRDDTHAEQCRIPAKSSRRLEAIDLGHVEIEESCIRFELFAERDGVGSVSPREHLDAGMTKHRKDGVPEDLIVFSVDETKRAGCEHCAHCGNRQTLSNRGRASWSARG